MIGFLLHVSFAVILVRYPSVLDVVENKIFTAINIQKSNKYNIHDEINFSFGSWVPERLKSIDPNKILIGSHEFENLQSAVDSLLPGDTLEIGPGVYKTSLVIKQDKISVVGRGHVVFDGAIAEGKAAFVIKGNDFSIYNIECKGVKASDQNGACVRMEGANLTLNHVYFHDSEQGVLTGSQPEKVIIKDSRFELLGRNGQAHGIYIGGGELHIEDSLFIAAVDEGHEIKSRAKVIEIIRTVIASLSSSDSRLIDISNGGVVSIKDSILEKGPESTNADLIGFGLEGNKYKNNYIELKNNIVIMERDGPNNLIHSVDGGIDPVFDSNIIISKYDPLLTGINIWYKNRKTAGLKDYPFVPVLNKN